MNIITIGHTKCLTPASWNELTREQLLYVASVFYCSKITVHQAKESIIYKFLSIKNKVLQHINQSQYDALANTTEFLIKNITLTKNIIQSFNHSIFRYHGPKDKLSNINLGEFSFADTFFLKYSKTKEIEYLDKLIATLYRPRSYNIFKKTGDIRRKFNKHTIEKRAKKISKLKPEIKYAILMYYRGCRSLLKQRFPAVFTSDNQSKVKSNNLGWGAVIIELSGTKFGSYKETEYANLYVVLSYIQMVSEQNAEMEKRLNKINNKNRKRRA